MTEAAYSEMSSKESPVTSPTEALAELRQAERVFLDWPVSDARELQLARLARAEAFPRLLAIAEAAAAALDQCDSLERGERWWYRLRDTLASLTSEETPAPTLMEAPNETRPHSAPRLDP